jgi:hypothetical protein
MVMVIALLAVTCLFPKYSFLSRLAAANRDPGSATTPMFIVTVFVIAER